MENRQGIGRAHGKIILMGEHAVVYGEPAVALPFKELTAITTVTPAPSVSIQCIYFEGPLDQAPPQLDNLKAVVQAVKARLRQESAGFHIRIDSRIPQERGMGSSAAVANSLVRALYDYFREPLDDGTLFGLTQTAETIAHGSPSGLDAKTTVSEKPLYFMKNQLLEPIRITLQGYIVAADTGEKGQTKLAVGAVAELKKNDPAAAETLIHGLGNLSRLVRELLSDDDFDRLGQSMNQAQTMLRTLGVSNDALDRLVSAALRSGSPGAKLTGGGRGGCLIALARTLEEAERLEEALLQSGAAQVWKLKL